MINEGESLVQAAKRELEEDLKQLDLNVLTPIEALNKLYALQKKIEKK